jgi:hypothetical protein
MQSSNTILMIEDTLEEFPEAVGQLGLDWLQLNKGPSY